MEQETADSPVPEATRERNLMVFELGGTLYGVDAARVDSVIPWREPVPLPGAGPSVAGVVQDRGRIVTVIRPRGGSTGDVAAVPARIIVCSTARGHVGLPASSARAVGTVELRSIESPGATVETNAGALVWLDPDALVETIRGEEESAK